MDSLFLVCWLSIAATAPVTSTLLGGYETVDPSDKGVQRALSFAVKQLNDRSNSIFYMKDADVLHASTQVVKGTNYRIEFEFVTTDCRKNNRVPENLEYCKVSVGNNEQICEVVVNEQLWNDKIDLVSSKCEPLTGSNKT